MNAPPVDAPTLLLVGGQRRGMSNAEGADNAVAFLNRIKARAEDKGVTICLEVMNSKLQDPPRPKGSDVRSPRVGCGRHPSA